MFVCVFDSSCINALHIRKVDQRSYHGFYCFTSHFYHFLGIFLVLGEFLVHAVVMFFVVGVSGNAGQSNYSASKASMIGLVHSVVMFFVDAVVQFFKLGSFTTTWLS